MSADCLSMELNLGPTFTNDAFRVRLDAEKLQELVRHTEVARRIYELMLINRPGDVLDYVWVMLEKLSERALVRVDVARRNCLEQHDSARCAWPAGRIPFNTFDRLFYWAEEDTEADDEAWLRFRGSAQMRSFMQQAYATVVAAQNRLAWGDHLQRHVLSRIRSGEHPYCYLDREEAKRRCRSVSHSADRHTDAFYEKLSHLLYDPELTSAAYRANGDFRVLRMMATEQRRRAMVTGHTARDALVLSANSNCGVDSEDWDSAIWFYGEGLGYGDLLIQGSEMCDHDINQLTHSRLRAPGKYLLTTQELGNIDGFTMASGDGWVLYTKEQPRLRRHSLQLTQRHRSNKIGPILSFAGDAETLFHHEKALIVVGAEVSHAARAVLASIIAEWQQGGGDPLVLVFGDTAPFDLAACEDTLQVPPGTNGDDPLTDWFFKKLQLSRPWIDVVLSLHAPPWVQQLLANVLDDGDRPWQAWIAAAGDEFGLTGDCRLDGNLAEVLLDAAHQAKAMRPTRN